MMATSKRLFAWLGASFALSAVSLACGSSAPTRPAALDPSNPDAPESAPMAAHSQAAEATAMDSGMNMHTSADAGAMHQDVTSDQPGRCPKCGMKLLPKAKAAAPDSPMTPHLASVAAGTMPTGGFK